MLDWNGWGNPAAALVALVMLAAGCTLIAWAVVTALGTRKVSREQRYRAGVARRLRIVEQRSRADILVSQPVARARLVPGAIGPDGSSCLALPGAGAPLAPAVQRTDRPAGSALRRARRRLASVIHAGRVHVHVHTPLHGGDLVIHQHRYGILSHRHRP